MMAKNNEQLLLNSLNEIKADFKEIKSDIGQIKVDIAKTQTNLAWIKVLFPLTFTVIIFLLGVLIRIISLMP